MVNGLHDIANIYQDRSFLMTYGVMMSELENCESGLVARNGEYSAGGIVLHKDGNIYSGVFVAANISGDFAAWLARMHKDFYCCGISKLDVFCSDEFQVSHPGGHDFMKNIELRPYGSVF